MYFDRKVYLDQLIRKKHNSLVKVITGARRSGKSYLMNNIFYKSLLNEGIKEKNIIRFSFDNDEHIDLLDDFFPEEKTKIIVGKDNYIINSKKFRAYIKSVTNDNEYFYLLLDEIQMLDSFVGTLNGFLSHSNFDIYVTGSNSQLLSSEIETKFRGRKSSIHLLPLSFSEFVTGANLSPESAWRKYIVTGGIPIIYQQDEEDREKYLLDLCYETYLKDIIGRKNIKDADNLSDLLGVLASCIGSGVSPSNLEKTFKLNKNIIMCDDTISNYINHFQDAFVISIAKKYNIKGKAYINTPYKVYFEDIGVRNAKTNFSQIEESHIMENIIYNELRYRGFNVSVGEIDVNEMTDRIDVNGKHIYKKKSLEVDFIATKDSQKIYVQSCLNINDENTLNREKRSLYYIDDSFKKIIVTKNGLDPYYDSNGFLIVDIFDFLLNPKFLL
ncbi:MAG: ATP-binding protein [Bacillales bacterium]|nr:ATP-binding protein [Bacillales bacterium]MDY6003515.1 ATP-binding protein [Bacilli bacterium]